MIGAAVLLVATIASIELIRLLGLFAMFGSMAQAIRRALRIATRGRVSEWAKERALRLASVRLIAASLRSGLILLLVAAPLIAVLMLDRRYSLGVRASMADWHARLWLLALTCAYTLLRRGMRTALSGGERVLQRVTLGNPAVLDISLALERRLHPAGPDESVDSSPVFIVGLARAGTSILTRILHETGAFASLTYRDLPFPLAPNIWARASRNMRRQVAARERGHADGLTHDLDTPEAIEELFWLSREGDRYRFREGLAPVHPAPDTIEAFRDYTRLVCRRYQTPRYLSKNNNNMLRLPALVSAFPEAILLHPFRDPVEQSGSFLLQHLRACAMAEDDPYRRDFMRWLGHHEFGADHRPYLLRDGVQGGDPATIDYWLQRWIDAYGFLLAQPEAVRRRQIFVDYDALCAAPETGLRDLAGRLALGRPLDTGALRPAMRHAGRRASRAILSEARVLYGDLCEEARQTAKLRSRTYA